MRSAKGALFASLGRAAPDRAWFWARFTEASETIIMTWGPRWAKRRAAGRPLGVWLLGAVWLAIPVVVILAVGGW